MIKQKYNSLNELIKFVDDPDHMNKLAGKFPDHPNLAYSRYNENDGWSGAKDWKEAVSTAKAGYPIGVEKIRLAKAKITTAETAKMVRSVVGFAPCVGAFLKGDPRSMYSKKRVQTPITTMKLSIASEFGSSVKPNEIIEAGAKVCALIDALEAHGIRVEVDMLWSSTDKGSITSLLTVCIKHANERLNLNTFAYCTAHPSFARRLCFAWYERVDGTSIEYGGSTTGIQPFKSAGVDGCIINLKDLLPENGVSAQDLIRLYLKDK